MRGRAATSYTDICVAEKSLRHHKLFSFLFVFFFFFFFIPSLNSVKPKCPLLLFYTVKLSSF